MISVIIPMYNAEKFIKKAVESVINQTFDDWELIIINDGSTDSSYEIVEKLIKKDERIHLINQKNGGVSKARNTGILAAGGAVTFLDADDELLPNALEVMLGCINEYDADICVANETVCNGTRLYNPSECIKLCIEDSPLVHACWGKLYKTQWLKENKIFFPEGKSSHEDSFFVFKCFYCGMNMVALNHKVYIYNVELQDSLSRGCFSKSKFSILELAKLKYELINARFPEYRFVSENILIKAYMSLLNNLVGSSEYKKFEKESIKYIIHQRKYFIPASKFDKKWFFIITHRLYFVYKMIKKIKRMVIKNEQ